MVMKSPQSISPLSQHLWILLKQKCVNHPVLDLSSDYNKLYQSLIRNSLLNKEQNEIKLQLQDFDSLTHQKFYNAIQKILKLKGSREMKPKFELTTKAIKFPYSRTQQDFPPVIITGESKSKNMLEIKITGASGLIIIAFFLKPILKTFLKSIESVQPNRLWSEETYSTSLDAKFNKFTKENKGNKRGMDFLDDKTPINKKSKKLSDNTDESENLKKVTLEDVTDCESDGVDKPDINNFRSNENSKITTVSNLCYTCALLYIAENIEDLLKSEDVEFQMECKFKCSNADCLVQLVQSISMLVSFHDIDEVSFDYLKKNFGSMFSSLLDNTTYIRADLYWEILGNLGNIPINKQHRIMTMLRELCEMFIGEDFILFEETMQRNRLARRNSIKFIKKSGNFFAIQSVLESWNIMFNKGIDLRSLLPPYLSYIAEMFSSAPEISSAGYFLFIAEVTREVIANIFNGENVNFVKAVKIEFKSGSTLVEKPWDLHIYFNKVDKAICHFLWADGSVICEEIKFSELKYDEETKRIYNQQWNFFLPNVVDSGSQTLINSLTKSSAENINLCQEKDMSEDEENTVVNKVYSQIDPTSEEQIGNKTTRNRNENLDDVKNIDDDDDDNNHDDNDDLYEDPDDEASNHTTDDSKLDESPDQTVEAFLVVPKENVSRYWNEKSRSFLRNLCGQDWPNAYGSPCAVVFQYVHVKKFESAKRTNHFAKLVGYCKICNSKHICIIQDCPFDEKLAKDGKPSYDPQRDLCIDITVTGKFELKDDDTPDIGKPKHKLVKASGLFLKGKERQVIGEKVSKMGVQNAFMEQFDNVNENQMKTGNKTSVKSYDVLIMARQEYEKKQRCGDDFFQSVQNIIDSQHIDTSLNFEDTTANRQLAGFVRSVQQSPFKLIMGNYDQLRIGANYMNKKENPTIFMDSSGKFLKKEKGKSKLLNTAVVIPPPAKGHSPFPIFEMVSEKNRTIDFHTFIEYGWSYLSASINNEKVRYPRIAVSDFSFANIHSILGAFNKVKIDKYIETAYNCSVKNQKFPFETILTMCENHTLPNLLHYARNLHSDKVVADTLVAGLMKVFEAENVGLALKVFKNLALIHCSTEISKEARENIRESSFGDVDEIIGDFGDEAPPEDDVEYGNRKGLRLNSPYYKLFKKVLDDILKKNQETKISNKFYAPKLMLGMTKQYLSLFPLFSASMLPDKNLKTNSHIELYWKDQRRILANVPNRLRWPPRYLGELHAKIRRDAKSILTHGIVPNLKHGGKVKPGQSKPFQDYTEEPKTKTTKEDIFMPSKQKKDGRKTKHDETFGGSSERWDSQKSKDLSRKKDNYIKGKKIDHDAIISSMEIPFENLRVTGTTKLMTDQDLQLGLPESIILSTEEVRWLLTKNIYISSEVVDCGLILLDKRLNEQSRMNESIVVYTVLNLRLILGGDTSLVNKGKFLAIIPRDFGLSSEKERFETMKAGQKEQSSPGSHYTMVSNLQCNDGEVNVYETYHPYRSPEFLLNESGKKLLKILTHSKELQVNCINVQLQDECECGAISLGLAIQLCFYPADEGAVHYRMLDVRKELFRCLKENRLSYFKCSRVKTQQEEKILFSVKY